MKQLIYVEENFISPSECQELIDLSKSNKKEIPYGDDSRGGDTYLTHLDGIYLDKIENNVVDKVTNLCKSFDERVLIDYKDIVNEYRMTDLPALSMFCEPMSTDTGGNIDLTFRLPSMNLEQIDEGSTPTYQHTKLRSERVSVKEWGIAVGVTRRMLEDSRFSEMELALNEARRAVDRHITSHAVKALSLIHI